MGSTREDAHLSHAGVGATKDALIAGYKAEAPGLQAITLHLLNAVDEVMRLEATILDLGDKITRTVARVGGALGDDTGISTSTPNSLGELQRTGQEYDLACARLTSARDHLRVLGRLRTEHQQATTAA